MKIGGLPIDLRQVQVGAYVIGGTTDHITPWRGCYGTARLFGPESTFVLVDAPRNLGGGKYAPLGPAPGTYVHEH